jgi:hypothetical protein
MLTDWRNEELLECGVLYACKGARPLHWSERERERERERKTEREREIKRERKKDR